MACEDTLEAVLEWSRRIDGRALGPVLLAPDRHVAADLIKCPFQAALIELGRV